MSHFLQFASDTANASSYTFSSQNLGAAASDRYIVCTTSTRKAGTTASTLDSVTIGGVSATINVQAQGTEDGNSCLSGIATAAVPTGTTGDVVVTWSDTMLRCGISLFRITGLSSSSAHDTATDVTSSLSVSLSIPAGDSVAIGETATGWTGVEASWTNLTEDHDTQVEGMNMSSAHDAFTSSESRTISVSWPTEEDPTLIAASFSIPAAATDPASWKTLLGSGVG